MNGDCFGEKILRPYATPVNNPRFNLVQHS
jgi:hypothetical protein